MGYSLPEKVELRKMLMLRDFFSGINSKLPFKIEIIRDSASLFNKAHIFSGKF